MGSHSLLTGIRRCGFWVIPFLGLWAGLCGFHRPVWGLHGLFKKVFIYSLQCAQPHVDDCGCGDRWFLSSYLNLSPFWSSYLSRVPGCGVCGTTTFLDIHTEELEKMFVFIALDKDAVKRAEAAGFNAVLNEPLGPVDLQDMAASMDIINTPGPFNEGAWPVDLKKLANPPSWIFEFDQKVLTRRFDSCTFCNYLLRQDDIWKMRWLIQTTCIALGLEVLVVDSATWHINVIMKLVMRSCLNLSSFCQQLTRMIQYCLHSKVIKVSSIYSLQVERLQPPKTNTEPDKWSVAWEFPFSKRPQFSRRTFPEWKSWIFPRKKT